MEKKNIKVKDKGNIKTEAEVGVGDLKRAIRSKRDLYIVLTQHRELKSKSYRYLVSISSQLIELDPVIFFKVLFQEIRS